jgi:hypothetical protein
MYDTLFSFVLIILIGVVFRKFGIGKESADSIRRMINITVLNLFLPALCIKTIYTSKIDMEIALVPTAAWITVISTLLFSLGIYTALGKIMNIKPSEKGVLILSAAFGNVTYLGIPVLTSLYGYEAAKYALFYDLLATTPILWLIGAPIAAKYGEGKKIEIAESLKAIISLPPIWGILIGIILNLTGIPLPSFMTKALDMLSSIVIPLMIFSIGLALSILKVKHAYIIIPAVIIKLIVSPFISFIAAYSLGLDRIALASCFIEGAMPTMVLSLLIAARFKLDTSLSAFTIVVTTIISFITLPVAIHITKILI